MILCISVVSVVISPLSFLILLNWFFSFCFLMSLANGLSTDFIFLGSKITEDCDCSHKLKDTCSLEEKLCKPRHVIKKQRYHFANKGTYSPSYGFSSSYVWM